jgi:hypothetical protein
MPLPGRNAIFTTRNHFGNIGMNGRQFIAGVCPLGKSSGAPSAACQLWPQETMKDSQEWSVYSGVTEQQPFCNQISRRGIISQLSPYESNTQSIWNLAL